MQQLTADPGVMALSLHVDYWDYIGWADSFAQARFTDLMDLLHFGHTLESPLPVRTPPQRLPTLTQLARRAPHQRLGHRRQQDLAGARELHQAGRIGFGQAFDLHRLGA